MFTLNYAIPLKKLHTPSQGLDINNYFVIQERQHRTGPNECKFGKTDRQCPIARQHFPTLPCFVAINTLVQGKNTKIPLIQIPLFTFLNTRRVVYIHAIILKYLNINDNENRRGNPETQTKLGTRHRKLGVKKSLEIPKG